MLVAAVTAGVALGVAFAPGVAGAQEDGAATLSVEQTHPSSTSVHYIVELTEAGGSPVDGATVTATPTGPDGTQGAPVDLSAAGEGQYQGTVQLSESGTWTVQFASTNPSAVLEHTQEMPAEAESADDDGGGGSAVVLILAAVFLAVVAAIAGWIWFTRQREPVDDPVGPPEQP